MLLGELLSERGIAAQAERRADGDAPDLRIGRLAGDEFALVECKWAGARTQLDAQLAERVGEFPAAIGRIGVLYPAGLDTADDVGRALAEAEDLSWYLHSTRERVEPHPQMRRGSAHQLADFLRVLPLQVEGVDRVAAAANAVRYATETAAKELSRHARISERASAEIAESDRETDRSAALRIGCLVLFNALAFEERLSAAHPRVPTVSEAAKRGAPGLRDAWRMICEEIDYVPVFQLAADILDILCDAPAPAQDAVIEVLIRAVDDTRGVEGHDLSGRLFHTLLSDAKFTGAYYTSVPAATLLSRLVFDSWPAETDWTDHAFPGSLNIADIACGTGTLLMAVASEAERRHVAAGGAERDALHKAMVEQALHGFDVQLSAVHFAATSLAMLNPAIHFDRMNLYVMPLGASGEDVQLGSLDFLGQSEAPVQFPLPTSDAVEPAVPAKVRGGGGTGVLESERETAVLPPLDLAIMNPPFTRSDLLFGSLSPGERQRIQAEIRDRLKSHSASAVAGVGAAFVAAVAPKIRAGEGRLALVLPLTVCTGRSWRQTRALIERDFRLDMVIASHDPQRWNFSDSTDLSEALLIATKRAEGDAGESRTTYVNLWENPDNVLDAGRLADVIAAIAPVELEAPGTALLELDGRHVGETVSLPAERGSGGQWLGVQFSRADVTRAAAALLNDGEVQVPGERDATAIHLCALEELGPLGPDRRDILDGFAYTDTPTAYPFVAGHDTNERTTLRVVPNRYLAPLAKPRAGRRLKTAVDLGQRAARLLVAERLRLDTTRVVSMRCDRPVLSNVFWELGTADERYDAALGLWLNSSLGVLTLLGTRTTTEGGWVSLKKGDLEEMPVLDVRGLSDRQLEQLGELFEELAEEVLLPLPEMGDCSVRARLDGGLAEVLGLPDLTPLRRMLASEPAVSNRRLTETG